MPARRSGGAADTAGPALGRNRAAARLKPACPACLRRRAVAAGSGGRARMRRARAREHSIDSMAVTDVHVGGFPGQEASSASLCIIKSFVKPKRNSRRRCAYVILTVEKFTSQDARARARRYCRRGLPLLPAGPVVAREANGRRASGNNGDGDGDASGGKEPSDAGLARHSGCS